MRPLCNKILSASFQCVKVNFHRRVIFTSVKKIEAMYEVSRVNVKVERGSTFKFTRDLSFIHYLYFVNTSKFHARVLVKITRQLNLS